MRRPGTSGTPEAPEAPARLRVDPTACRAVGICAHLAPDLVALDDWGYPVLPEALVDPRGQARRAVAGCPRRALGWAETG